MEQRRHRVEELFRDSDITDTDITDADTIAEAADAR